MTVATVTSTRIGLPLAAGLTAALLFLSPAHGIDHGPLLGFLTSLPLMAAGLGLGQVAALGAIAVGLVAVGLVEGWDHAVALAAMAGLPTMVVTNRALAWRPGEDGKLVWPSPGTVLAWLAVAVMALCAVWAALLPHHDGGIRGWVAEWVAQAVALVDSQLSAEERQAALRLLGFGLPAMVMGVWLVMAVINATIAQAILAATGHSLRPTPAYAELDLPDWMLGILAAAAVAAGVGGGGGVGYLAGNMAVAGLVPFSALGLATVHRSLAARPGGRMGLVAMYVFVALANVWALMLAAGLGLVRFMLIRFRRRAASGGGKEE